MQNKKSLYSLAFVGIVLILSMQFYERWDTNIIGGGDSWGYYLFLPATFIHGDLDSLDVSLAARKQYHNGYYTTDVNPLGVDEVIHVGEGKQVSKYTYGIALLEAPMFFLAHGIAKITGQPADGYSWIYIYMMHLSNALFVLWGLYYLRRFLLFYFKDSIVSIILCILAIGTNLYYFSIYNSAMAHSYLFALYCFLLYHTHLFYKDKKILHAIGIGVSAGLITLIRPTEIICLLIPVLYGLNSLGSFKEKISFINENKAAFAIAVITYIMMGLPQLLYWKYATGEFFFYTYGEEGFDFTKPKFLKGLFSFRNGWLAYTPLMALALMGIPFLFKKMNRDFLLPVISFTLIHLWITYSWWCWYYINGFGSRPMVEAYAVLSIPLGYFLTFVFQKKWSKILFAILVPAFIALNLFQTYKFSLGVLWTQDANRAYYFSTFFKTKINMQDLMTYDSGIWQPDPSQLDYIKTIAEDKFEDSTNVQMVLPNPQHDGLAYHLTPNAQYTTSIHLPIEGMDLKKGDWLRISAKCMRKHHDANYHNMSKLVFHFEEEGKIHHWKDVILDNKPGNTKPHLWGGVADVWDEVVYWVKVPSKVKRMDKIKVFGWNYTANEIYVDDLKVEHWR